MSNIQDILGDVSVAETTFTGILVVVIGLVIRHILNGDLRPKSQFDEMIAEKDKQLEDKSKQIERLEEFKSAALSLMSEQQDAISDLTEGVANLGESAQLNVRVAEALRAIIEKKDEAT